MPKPNPLMTSLETGLAAAVAAATAGREDPAAGQAELSRQDRENFDRIGYCFGVLEKFDAGTIPFVAGAMGLHRWPEDEAWCRDVAKAVEAQAPCPAHPDPRMQEILWPRSFAA